MVTCGLLVDTRSREGVTCSLVVFTGGVLAFTCGPGFFANLLDDLLIVALLLIGYLRMTDGYLRSTGGYSFFGCIYWQSGGFYLRDGIFFQSNCQKKERDLCVRVFVEHVHALE